MRQLSQCERRYLDAIPHDSMGADGHNWKGTIRKEQWPSRVSVTTLMNLRDLGLIEHGRDNLYVCPMQLTDEGRRVIGMAPFVRD